MSDESIITIDSQQRDKTLYQNNYNFTYKCKKTYQNPKQLQLLGAVIANSQYVINTNNQSFNVTSGVTLYTATLTNQNYTPTTLATQLQTKLNALAIPATTFTVTADTNANKFTIASTSAVTYNFSLNTQLANVMGFSVTDSGSVTSITSTNMYNVSTTRYYKLVIKELYSDYDTNISGQFNFVIWNNTQAGAYTYLTNSNNINNVLNIDKKINLSTMTIELYDEWGNYCLLNGMEYILVFKLIT